jgi:hypothetical protein
MEREGIHLNMTIPRTVNGHEDDEEKGTRPLCRSDRDGHSVLWRRLDEPGHEFCRLSYLPTGPALSGIALFVEEQVPVSLHYRVACDLRWRTVSAEVTGCFGARDVSCAITVDDSRSWRLDGHDCQGLRGVEDLDLSFSPSTNLLPVRRLGLAVGDTAEVTAARLRLPDLVIEPLVQVYRRTGPATYRYEAAAYGYGAELELNPAGFVRRYPGLWALEAES